MKGQNACWSLPITISLLLPFENSQRIRRQQCRISSSHKGILMPLNLALVHTHIDFWVVYCGSCTHNKIICCVRTGEARKRQPDNFQGLKAGRSVNAESGSPTFLFKLPEVVVGEPDWSKRRVYFWILHRKNIPG